MELAHAASVLLTGAVFFKKHKMKKIIIISVLLFSIGILAYHYIYQDHRNIETEQPDLKSTPENIISEFKLDAASSEKKHLNKTIEIRGLITELNKKDLTLNTSVFCQFTKSLTAILNSEVNVKGRCIGYDDLLEQVKLDQCVIIR